MMTKQNTNMPVVLSPNNSLSDHAAFRQAEIKQL
jgi:hypothetical protein